MITLRTLPFPLKILATCALLTMGLGYLFAMTYLYLTSIQPHAEGGLVNAIGIKYHGPYGVTRLEEALQGKMRAYGSDEERSDILRWVREGAAEADFMRIQPRLVRACGGCHSAEAGMGLAPLTTYVQVSQYTSTEFGQSVMALARVSHVHLFGMTFIFALTSFILAFSERAQWLKAWLIAIPFIAIWVDIGSWWFTKFDPLFAYTVIAGGIMMGLSLAAQLSLSLYELWHRSS